jgi:hypothetical protein
LVKKQATGKGNADKSMMVESFRQETKIDLLAAMTPNRASVGSPVTDIVDSYFVCRSLYYSIMEIPPPNACLEDDGN